jgi:ABC-type antimicrobial peptide transport system permease subunit
MEARDGVSADPVIVVNEAFAQRHWPGENPVGRSVVFDGAEHRVVGLVENTMDWDRRTEPTVYRSAIQVGNSYMNLVVRTLTPVGQLRDFVTSSVATLDPGLPVLRIQAMEEVNRRERAGETVLSLLVAVVAGIAFLLSLVGIFGLTANAVSRRTREIGVRIAVGAPTTQVLASVTKQSMVPLLLGTILGLGLAVVLGRGISAFLFRVGPVYLPAFFGVAAAVLATGLLAALVPARRAVEIDPVSALREE